ncbi:maestro heat-like repeat family member 5 [Manacus candei]|uniref:maestro heat-like repeat family member 5 n=1 Tax=Manacus candei TaxID=415023 RepID=UPI00222678D1|nr:maestro heat-like repeat family member 5 [Manacus candei]
MREAFICLFRDYLGSAVLRNNKQLKTSLRSALVPLLIRTSDQSPSVAKAAQEALLAAAKLLKWRELKELVKKQQMWRIGECLVGKDRSRAEEYLRQGLSYLKDPEASVREAAIRFIGVATRHLRNRSQEQLDEICSSEWGTWAGGDVWASLQTQGFISAPFLLLTALQPLKTDSNVVVSCLAEQTISILTALGPTPSPRFRPEALLFWRRRPHP